MHWNTVNGTTIYDQAQEYAIYEYNQILRNGDDARRSLFGAW
jgi:hypothetical protein